MHDIPGKKTEKKNKNIKPVYNEDKCTLSLHLRRSFCIYRRTVMYTVGPSINLNLARPTPVGMIIIKKCVSRVIPASNYV